MNIARNLWTAVVVTTISTVALDLPAQTTESVLRGPDDHPDLNGTWFNGDGVTHVRPLRKENFLCIRGCEAETPGPPRLTPDRPSYKTGFLSIVSDLDNRQVEEDPALRCFPPGVPRIGPPDKIIQIPSQIIFLYNDITGSHFRIVPTDGRTHRTDIGPSYLGDAIGHWEGDTLVVDTTNFADHAAGNSFEIPSGADKNLLERLTLSDDGKRVSYEWVLEDPEYMTEPIVGDGSWEYRPDLERQPPECDLEVARRFIERPAPAE